MSFAFRALTHPVAPIAWWALNTPEVTSKFSAALGLDAQARRLQRYYYTEDERYVDEEWKEVYIWIAIGGVVASIVIPIIAWAITGSVYKKNVTDQRSAFPEPVPPELSLAGKDFKYGICQFKDDCNYCMHGWFLETVRVADTYNTVQAASFWTVMIMFLLTWFVAQVISFGMQMALRELAGDYEQMRNNSNQFGSLAWFVANFFLAWYLAGLRKNLRAKFGDTNPGSKFFNDFLMYWFCSCCVVVQEARQVDEAMGVRVECCCKLVKVAPPIQVGAPVVVVGNVVEG